MVGRGIPAEPDCSENTFLDAALSAPASGSGWRERLRERLALAAEKAYTTVSQVNWTVQYAAVGNPVPFGGRRKS